MQLQCSLYCKCWICLSFQKLDVRGLEPPAIAGYLVPETSPISPGTNLQIVCNEGFSLTGRLHNNVVCLTNFWIPFLSETRCPWPRTPRNGWIPNIRRGPFSPGMNLRILCDEGYSLTGGTSVIKCLPFGRWNDTGHMCLRHRKDTILVI